jgi:3-methyladenine DNA glycosylase AlkD
MTATSIAKRRDEALAWLEKRGTKKGREGMARFGIVAKKVFGVSVGTTRELAKHLGRDHALAEALWKTGWYEARLLATFVDDPRLVTPAQMDRWCKDFENWADCDTACFSLFDRTPHAWGRVKMWSTRKREFEKRAAFALLAGMALHDKKGPDEPFAKSLPLIKRAATDERNFVKKGVSWALRGIGERSSPLNAAAVKLARKLADSDSAPARWIGKDALRQLDTPAVAARLKKRSARNAR